MVIVMKSNNYIISLLGVGILFMLITIVNAPFQLFPQNTVNASTQADQENDDSSSGSADDPETTRELSKTAQASTQESDNATTNDETLVLQDQDQVQSPQQLDTISPKILSVTPNIGTSGIPVTTNITATFSEPVDALTLDSKTFTLQTDDNEVKGTISASSDGTTATFIPSSSLSGSTIYTASISEVKDLAGNTMSYASPWSFTTEAQAAPPSQQPPSNPGGGGSGNSGSNSGSSGGIFGDIKTSPSESGVLKDAAQYVEDEKLVDRILPIILFKMDKRQLAATVLPYLDLQVTVRQAQGESKSAQGDTTANFLSSSSCSPGEILIGGAFGATGATKILISSMNGNQWQVSSIHNPYYSHVGIDQSVTSSYAICMTINLVPKDPYSLTLTNEASQ